MEAAQFFNGLLLISSLKGKEFASDAVFLGLYRRLHRRLPVTNKILLTFLIAMKACILYLYRLHSFSFDLVNLFVPIDFKQFNN